MVNFNVSSPTRTHVYESLYLISHLTEQIAYHLNRLRSAKVLVAGIVEEEKEAAKELRARVIASSAMNLQREEMEAASQHQKNRMRMRRSLREVVRGGRASKGDLLPTGKFRNRFLLCK